MKILLSAFIGLFLLTGCNILNAIAPVPAATSAATPTTSLPTPSPEPTMGELEYIDAVYCWVSHIDDAEYNLIRFFPSGKLIDIFVQGYASCEEAWQKSAQYITEDKLMNFSHGEYRLSNEWITFTLSAINSKEIVGEVKGTYSPERMWLTRQGSEKREYVVVVEGK